MVRPLSLNMIANVTPTLDISTEVQMEIATIRVWLLNNDNVLIVSISNIMRHQYQTFQPQKHMPTLWLNQPLKKILSFNQLWLLSQNLRGKLGMNRLAQKPIGFYVPNIYWFVTSGQLPFSFRICGTPMRDKSRNVATLSICKLTSHSITTNAFFGFGYSVISVDVDYNLELKSTTWVSDGWLKFESNIRRKLNYTELY